MPARVQVDAQKLNDDLVKVRDQVASSLDIQQRQVSRELQDNTRLLVNRFMREIRGLREEVDRQKKLDRDLLTAKLDATSKRGFFEVNPLWVCLVSTLLVGLTWALYALNSVNQTHAQLLAEKNTLTQTIQQQKRRIDGHDAKSNAKLAASNDRKLNRMLNALVWAINQEGRFEFSETALGEERTEMMSGLLQHLSEVDFVGTLTLEIHNGDFCVVRDEVGALALPTELVLLSECDFLSNTAYSFDTASQTSVPFLNLLQSYPIVARGDLQVNIKAHGVANPSRSYPEYSESITSEQWNSVASANNRLNISLHN